MRVILLLAGVLFLHTHLSAQLQDWQKKVDASVLEKAKTGAVVDFLVIMQEQADVSAAQNLRKKADKAQYVFETLQAVAQRTQAPLYPILAEAKALYQPLFLVNLIQVKGDLALIKKLAQRTDVAHLATNPMVKFDGPVEQQYSDVAMRGTVEWGIKMINADAVWDLGYKGQGVVVGGQDTGYEWTHPALKEKYRGWKEGETDHNYNWHDAIHEISILNDTINDPNLNRCGLDVTFPCDDDSHGTHTMGTMVGEVGENQIGVAPQAQWIGCRNMERGYGSPFTYLECFQWFLAPTDLQNQNPDPEKAPHVINNSWSCPQMEGCTPATFEMLQLAVQNLRESGVVVVVSAGNSGSNCSSVNTPAAIYDGSFSIGATRQNDTIVGFSSRGPVLVDGSQRIKPNVVAPGVSVRSSVPGNGYASFSGTSMAGPHVAGAVALLISSNPELEGQVELIETILEQTAVPKTIDQDCGGISGDSIPNNTYGFGRIDVFAAVELAKSLTSVNDPAQVAATVQVFPNPATDEVTFFSRSLNKDAVISLFDAHGRLVLQSNWKATQGFSKQISVQALPKGIYFYSVRGVDIAVQGKLLRQ